MKKHKLSNGLFAWMVLVLFYNRGGITEKRIAKPHKHSLVQYDFDIPPVNLN